jgi:hypothetical protein
MWAGLVSRPKREREREREGFSNSFPFSFISNPFQSLFLKAF